MATPTTRTVSNLQAGDSISVKTDLGTVAGEVVRTFPSGANINVVIATAKGDMTLSFLPSDAVDIVPPVKVLHVAIHHHDGAPAAHLFLTEGSKVQVDEVRLARVLGCSLDPGKDAKLTWAPVVNAAIDNPEAIRDPSGKPLAVYTRS
jgi:hypothetical protein